MTEKQMTWPKYSTKDAFEDGKCRFDNGGSCDIMDDVYNDPQLKNAFIDGWTYQESKKSRVN